ncbi:hypothetical protein, partial [Arthrobacter sp. Cr_A7]|uniref:hypothetical protein n=1 Tax=Arthrobacter sp. Cr_A7 TaxID=3031017 RepID=UPI0023DAFE4F
RLAAANPALHEPDLALALSTLSNRLSEAGDRSAEALDAAQESVTIRQRLAAANPALYEPHVARALNNLANRLADAGMNTEATVSWNELLHIYERLARRDSQFSESLIRIQRIVWERTQLP